MHRPPRLKTQQTAQLLGICPEAVLILAPAGHIGRCRPRMFLPLDK